MHTSSPQPPPYYSLCLQLSDIPHEVIKLCNGWWQFSLSIFPALIALIMIYDVGPLMNIKWFIITRKLQASSYQLWDSLNIFILFLFSLSKICMHCMYMIKFLSAESTLHLFIYLSSSCSATVRTLLLTALCSIAFIIFIFYLLFFFFT